LIEPFINIATEPVNENEVPTIDSGTEIIRGADRRSMHIAALYMSMYGHGELQVGNQTQTFAYLGRKYDVAANTVKNIRDRFDFYVDNHRRGWDAPLPNYLQVVLDEFRGLEEKDLRGSL
jgi:hypothetical protein